MRRPQVFAAARVLILLTAPIVGAKMAEAGFPEPAQLPSHPGLPDPLVMFDGSRVSTPEQWTERRRPELKALFQHYMYGNLPAAPPSVQGTVDREDRNYLGGKATKKEVTIAFGPPATPKIHLLLVVPNKRSKPAPVFLGLNFQGNHAAIDDPTIALPTVWMPPNGPGVQDNKATDAGRGKQADVWSIEKVIDRGYALATIYCGDIAPDHPGFADGVFPHYDGSDGSKRGPNEWGAVGAWAWGLMRGVDYLRTDSDLDPGRIAVTGHSRLGKAALLAGAFDPRIALVVSHQAGCGGSAPSRGKVGEQVSQINDRFPHWFDDEFKKFNDQVDRLPFDQNGLVAMAAPRPVLLTNGVEDTWANPAGQFEVLKAAEPVYRLLGVAGIGEAGMPEPGRLVGDRLAYHIRPGKHSMGPEDWQVWLDYADKQLGKP
ncbi:alpha/beta hydrolase family protein [Tundrisphaera lichenicola]|uniref:alpha/beta hydrolase family protein n=1 Tax=Tundrisphaera lichenicola TaxID=2029860 RepID=UPI003EB73A6A